MTFAEMQLGKNGITDHFIQTLKSCFQNHESVRISILKSAGHDKKKVKEYAEELLGELGKYYTAKLIGFKIILKKWRRAVR
jgi:RNA-binding protein YhbY